MWKIFHIWEFLTIYSHYTSLIRAVALRSDTYVLYLSLRNIIGDSDWIAMLWPALALCRESQWLTQHAEHCDWQCSVTFHGRMKYKLFANFPLWYLFSYLVNYSSCEWFVPSFTIAHMTFVWISKGQWECDEYYNTSWNS